MKNIVVLISGILISTTAVAQTEKSQAEKTIDSVKAVQKQEQRPGSVTSKVVTSDALPLQDAQINNAYENNKINANGAINGNSIDTNNSRKYDVVPVIVPEKK